MKLGFYYHVPAALDGGRIRTPAFQGRFVDSLAEECSEVVVFLHPPAADEKHLVDYEIASSSVRLVDLGPRGSAPARVLWPGRFQQRFRQHLSGLDAVLLRGPSPLLPALAAAAREVPVALLLVGDLVAGLKDLRQPLWRLALIHLLNHWSERQQRRVIRRSLTLVNSRKLYAMYLGLAPAISEVRTSTLLESDFFVRDDISASRPMKLLCAGRITPGKGLTDVVKAMALLLTRGVEVELDIVGWADDGGQTIREVDALARSAGVAPLVSYLGYKPAGPELLACYRAAGVFVVASNTSEGFPRTIWEAMASSVPVVATRVGSIPEFLEDGVQALLIPPRSPGDLAEAIDRLAASADLRRRLIAGGRALARANTLERRTREMVVAIRRYCHRVAMARDPSASEAS